MGDAISSEANEARVLEIEEVDGRSRSHASRGRRSGSSQGESRRGPLAGRLRGNRADAAHGRISRRNGVQGVVVIHPRIHGALARVAQAARVVDTVEGVLGRGCVIPLRGWRKSDLGHAGRLRRRRGNATKSEPRAAMSAGGPSRKLEGLTLGRVAGRKPRDATSSHRMVPVGGACRRRGNVRGRR